ncbi:MAG: hypothetical protein QOI89_247 [Solirubrobacteraceae bacterium]|jgi:hypothetical protein|nr:hypothetical protein [Solirubrobacteraceae bacterium]
MRMISSQAGAVKGGSTRERSGDPRPEAPEPGTNGSGLPRRRRYGEVGKTEAAPSGSDVP